MKTDFYATPKSTPLMRFFWQAAGGDRYILDRATYSDQIKYMCLGGIVVATGVMAGIAGGYAFYTIFEPRGSALESGFDLQTSIMAIVFGVIWGLIIFNIDRFIVTSTGKGDGTEAITWGELKSALPRIFMGAIIALTISKPVEIRMFKTEIDTALFEKQQKLQTDYEVRTRANFEERIKDLANDNATIQLRIDDYLDKISIKDSLYNVETASGQGGRIKGEGPVAIALKNERDRLKTELDTYTGSNKIKIDDIEKRRKKLYDEMDVALGKNEVVANGLDGLLERIKLAHLVAGFWISFFITLLFMAIELTPIFFKLMLIKSPYDYLEENTKELMKAKQGIYIQYNYYKDKQGLERDLVRFLNVEKEILQQEKLLEAQKRLTEYAIDKYEEQIRRKIDASPEKFIRLESANSIADVEVSEVNSEGKVVSNITEEALV
jgi:hypothetical protein